MEKNWQPGECVWAKLKGYRWWPATIQNQSELPELIVSNKPKQCSGMHAVLFFGSEDYAWIGKDSLVPFKENYSTHSAGGKKPALFVKAVHEAALLTGLAKPTELKQPAKRAKKENKVEHIVQDEIETKPFNTRRRGRPAKVANSKKDSKNNEELIDQEIKALILDPADQVEQEATPSETFNELRRQLQKTTLKEKMKEATLIHEILNEIEEFKCDEQMINESKVLKVFRHILKFEPDDDENEEYRNSCNEIIERSKIVYKKLRAISDSNQEQALTSEKEEPAVVANVTQDLFTQIEHPEVKTTEADNKEFKDAVITSEKNKNDEEIVQPTEIDDKKEAFPSGENVTDLDTSKPDVGEENGVHSLNETSDEKNEKEEPSTVETTFQVEQDKPNGEECVKFDSLTKVDQANKSNTSEELKAGNTSPITTNGTDAAKISEAEAITNSTL